MRAVDPAGHILPCAGCGRLHGRFQRIGGDDNPAPAFVCGSCWTPVDRATALAMHRVATGQLAVQRDTDPITPYPPHDAAGYC